MKIKELKRELELSIKEAQEKGYEISTVWHNADKKWCCPFGALMLNKNIDRYWLTPWSHVEKLGVSPKQMYSFVDGFDGRTFNKEESIFSFWNLGRQYRDKYISIRKDLFTNE